jgi:gamma-glutamyltranspeptidase/glutathione hydrolase
MITAPTDHATRSLLARRAGAAGALGAVAASSPVAAAIGTAILQRGGSCVDAAVAAALAETVVLAPKCGLAGDVVALHLAPGAAAPEALVAVGPAPDELASMVRRRGVLPETGGLAVGVPGAPAGYGALAARGRLPLGELCAPAIALARRGFAWPRLCALLAAEADDLLVGHQPGGCRYRPASGALAAGDHVRLPGLATVLEAFASDGAGLFDGPLGAAVVAKVRAAGGVLLPSDLGRGEACWSAADRIDLPHANGGAGTAVWSTPGPTYGPALLAVLRQGAPDATGALARAVVRTLAEQAAAGHPGGPEGTSVVAAADADGGAVVIVHSNSFPQFGSGLVVDELDLVLNNRAGRGFSRDPANPNFPAPGRRPLTTLHAWAMGHDRPTLLGGTPGGAQQVAWNAQVLSGLLETGDPGLAVTDPLWRIEAGGVIAESDHVMVRSDQVIVGSDRGLAPSGADGDLAAPLSMRSAQVIVAPPRPGGLTRAWADPRHATVALAV